MNDHLRVYVPAPVCDSATERESGVSGLRAAGRTLVDAAAAEALSDPEGWLEAWQRSLQIQRNLRAGSYLERARAEFDHCMAVLNK